MKTLKKSDFNTILKMVTDEKRNYQSVANHFNSAGYRRASGHELRFSDISNFMIENGFRQRKPYIKPNARSKKSLNQLSFENVITAKKQPEQIKSTKIVLFSSDEFIEIMSSNIQTPVKKKLVNAIMEMVQN